MLDSTSQVVSTALFAAAVVHTFMTGWFNRLALRHREGSVKENLFHFLGEVEVVFGIWAAIFCAYLALRTGSADAISFLNSLSFTEPVFVFAIMATAATSPVLNLTGRALTALSRLIPLPGMIPECLTLLAAGPLLGSFITEPAAMTVTALLLRDRLFKHKMPPSMQYAALAVLFVNISIGGVLTPFAAPPVVMVAGKWGWNISYMLQNFGWKAFCAVSFNALAFCIVFRRQLLALAPTRQSQRSRQKMPSWLIVLHLTFLVAIVTVAHHVIAIAGLFLLFLGVAEITREYQDDLKIRESLLVGFFLAGLVVLGKGQEWWLRPLLESAGLQQLFWGATTLTAITDNAALTYLAAQVPDLSDAAKYAVVAGAVTGGGLTVIANAPNPAGYAILKGSFGESGIKPLALLAAAILPTLVAALLLMP